jgi:uncharacterized membrane protein YfcA
MTLELGGWAVAFVLLACAFSGFAHGAIGFGFPIVATPLLAVVLDIKSAIALIAPITLVLVVISALRGGGVVAVLRQFWPVLAGAAVGAWLGTRLLIAAPSEPFILILALAILLYLNLDRLGRGTSPAVKRRPRLFGLAFGFAGAFCRHARARPDRCGDLPALAARSAGDHGRGARRPVCTRNCRLRATVKIFNASTYS